VTLASHESIRAVSFDAGGTLIGTVEPVGVTYARCARDAGFTADAEFLDEGFRRAFAAAPPLAPPAGHAGSLREFELDWWRAIVAASLAHALGEPVTTSRASDFERFFAATFAFYADAAAWRVLPDAPGAVRGLRQLGLTLAVLSNFDGRLHHLLDTLGFAGMFAAAVPSSEAGAAKPARAAFEHVRGRVRDSHGSMFPAAQWLHVGDSVSEDVAGALDAGWQAIWIDRNGAASVTLPAGASRITSLDALPDLLRQGSSGS
jgi:putative hydrolase of the HAD superfamily